MPIDCHLNIRKTKSILFNPTKDKKTINISLKILDEKIEQVEEIKFLGVILDENLTWGKTYTIYKQKDSEKHRYNFQSTYNLKQKKHF